jgi:hypothetical protein
LREREREKEREIRGERERNRGGVRNRFVYLSVTGESRYIPTYMYCVTIFTDPILCDSK